jgi:hypothetical protein
LDAETGFDSFYATNGNYIIEFRLTKRQIILLIKLIIFMSNDLNSNDFNFDENRYFHLLKKEESLRNQDIYPWNENYGEYEELLSYRAILEQQFCYNRKDQYIPLVEEYLKENAGEAGAGLFRWEFSILWEYITSDLDILEKKNLFSNQTISLIL